MFSFKTQVVFIEDTEILLDSFKYLSQERISQIGDTHFFRCPNKAVDYIRSNRNREYIVVSDYEMPILKGNEVIRLLDREKINVKFFILTTAYDYVLEIESKFPKVFINKPFDIYKIEDMILRKLGMLEIIELIYIDDDLGVINSYKQFNKTYLKSKNPALFFQDSANAYEYIKNNSNRKIVVSDLNMPDKTGQDIYELLCSKEDECVFILLSGNAEIYKPKYQKVKFFPFAKPLSYKVLEKVIKENIEYLKGGENIQQ